jgi:hypothetical protein
MGNNENSPNAVKHPKPLGDLSFSWDNCKMDNNLIMVHFNHMYFPLGSIFNLEYPPIMYIICGDSSLSNHLPTLTITKLSKANSLKKNFEN